MKCVVFLVAAAFVCQAVMGTPRPYRTPYSNKQDGRSEHGYSSIHSHGWQDWQAETKPGTPKPNRPGQYGSSGSDESSEEVSGGDHSSFHPPWWRRSKKPNTPRPNKPESQDPHGHKDTDESSEEVTPSSNVNPSEGSGDGSKGLFLAPWPSSTTETPISKPDPLSSYFEQNLIRACIESCPVTAEYNPVCGNNNVTYQNPGRLECEKICGVDVELKGLTACSDSEVINTQRNKSREELVACIRKCPVTAEYNPVCGSNDVTYANPGRLECEQACGIPVQLVKLTACIADTTTPRIPTPEELTADCIKNCPVSAEFNPVCGSNNETYSNPGSLECAQNCGVEVQLSRQTSCGAPPTEEEIKKVTPIISKNSNNTRPFTNIILENNLGGENNESIQNNNNGEINVNSGSTDNGEISSNGETDGNDKSTGNIFNGGNNEDSFNQGKAGYHSGAVSSGYGGNQLNGGYGGNHGNYPGNNCNGINNNNIKKTPSVKELLQCMQLCVLTSESNPVCGTDDITYMNPGRLLCAQFCGIDVRVKKFAACSSSSCTCHHSQTPCTNPVTNNPPEVTPQNELKACIKACPSSQVFKPVCGTDKITYMNLEKLQCARRCGVDVSLLKGTNCSTPASNLTDGNPSGNTEKPSLQECIHLCSVTDKYEPICGTDNFTYNNTGHLLCARKCGLNVRIKLRSPCPSANPSTEKGHVTPGQNGLNFTIPPDVIASIWNETTVLTDDEDFDLDQRIQDSK